MGIRKLWVAALLCALPIQAGILIVERTQSLGRDASTSSSKAFIDAARLRFESGGDGHPQIVIYLAAEGIVYLIDPQEGTYFQFTREQLENMMNQVNQQTAKIQAMMAEKLKGMDPQQRQMMETILKQRMGSMMGGGEPPPKTTFRKVTSGEEIGQWSCDRYEGHRGEEKITDLWTTDWSDFGVQAADFQVFQDLAKMFEGLSDEMDVDFFQIGSENPQSDEEFSGIPVRRITYRDGQAYQKHEVLEVTRQDFDDELFKLQPELKKKEMPQFGGALPAQD